MVECLDEVEVERTMVQGQRLLLNVFKLLVPKFIQVAFNQQLQELALRYLQRKIMQVPVLAALTLKYLDLKKHEYETQY